MEDMMSTGIDEEVNETQEEQKQAAAEENKVVSIDEAKKRRPWHEWVVGGQVFKLKLTTANIMLLEKKYRTNVVNLLSGDGLPPLSVMLTIAQAAMLPYHHGIKSAQVSKIYDNYLEEGGGQSGLLNDVIVPTMMVSGFFTENQAEAMENKMGMDELI